MSLKQPNRVVGVKCVSSWLKSCYAGGVVLVSIDAVCKLSMFLFVEVLGIVKVVDCGLNWWILGISL
jgi:hypothetical protein